ncbi:MAG: TSUP family transporter [Candidatus Bathyarchaeia archaeon]
MIAVIVTLIVEFLGALIGLGGASIFIRILIWSDVLIKYGIAAGMVAIIATSSSSATSYVREHITNLKAAFYLQIFTVIGAIIGATINTLIAPEGV